MKVVNVHSDGMKEFAPLTNTMVNPLESEPPQEKHSQHRLVNQVRKKKVLKFCGGVERISLHGKRSGSEFLRDSLDSLPQENNLSLNLADPYRDGTSGEDEQQLFDVVWNGSVLEFSSLCG